MESEKKKLCEDVGNNYKLHGGPFSKKVWGPQKYPISPSWWAWFGERPLNFVGMSLIELTTTKLASLSILQLVSL